MTDETLEAIAEQAEIIQPDDELTLAGEKITVREFTFFQGMKLAATAAPLLDDFERQSSDQAELTLDLLDSLFGSHAEIMLQLISVSVGKPVKWVSELPDSEGQLLLMTFWRVNKDFFIQRLLIRKTAAAMTKPIGNQEPR